MPDEVLAFLQTQRVGVLAVKMPDGTPHGATVHFANSEDPFICIFLTSPSYRKCEPLRQGDTPASFVVGTEERVMKTLQMDGIAKLADTAALRDAYFSRFPDKLGKNPEDILFIFTPTSWQYTDWSKPKDRRVTTSG